MHGIVNLIKTTHCEKQLVQLINLNGRLQHLVQRKVVNRAVPIDYIPAFAMGADEPAAVDLDFALLANQPEFDGIPEQATQLLEDCFIFLGGADAPIVFQKFGEYACACMGTWPNTS